MPHKPRLISIRTQISAVTLLLLVAWLLTEGLWSYTQLGQQIAQQQREASENTLAKLSSSYIAQIEKELQTLPENAWQADPIHSSDWLSEHQILSIKLQPPAPKQPSRDIASYGPTTSQPGLSPLLSCLDKCSLWFSVTQPGSMQKWLIQSSLEPLLTQLAERGIIAVIQPQRMSESPEATLATFGQRLSTSPLSHAASSPLPLLDGNRLRYQGLRYQVWEQQLTWPPHMQLSSLDTPAWVIYFTPEPSVNLGSLFNQMAHSWSLLFPLLLLLTAIVIDATWGKRVRLLQEQLQLPNTAHTKKKNHAIYDEMTCISHNAASLLELLDDKDKALDSQSNELRQQALFDPLTGLYNRQCFMFELNRVIATQQRHTALLGLILLDINEFKRINSVIGLQLGDRLLQQLAQHMRHILRESDLLCRFNGDLFAILTSDIQQKENIHILMNKLFSQLQQPLELDLAQHRLQFSAGVVLIQKCFISASELLSQAELALQEAKSLGHNRYQLFTPSLLEKSVRHCLITKQFPQSLLNGHLSLHFQPIFDLTLGTIVGLEAFTRWHHPQEGYISPCEFIPILEESQLSQLWGDWVLEQAISQLYQLDKIGQSGLQITVNLTTRQLFSPSLPQVLERLTLAYHIRPDRIILELNEAPLIHDYKQAHALMSSLHEAGYRLSLDNFGSGYSALGYLHRLPFDYIKLASSFTLKMIDSDIDRQLVSSILQMSHAQGKKVVGERVDNALQSSLLQELGCDQLQGYLICHPLSECDLASQLATLKSKYSKQPHARHHP